MAESTTGSVRGGRIRNVLRRISAGVGRWLFDYRHEMFIVAFIAAGAFMFLIPYIWYTIPAGHVGVLWKRFEGGTVLNRVISEGTRLILPWDRLYIYDARLQQVQNDVAVLASDGLQITLTLAWRYHLEPDTVARLHKYVGPNYGATLISPTVAARARDVIATYRPEEVYTENRLKIQNEILESVRYELYNRFNPSGQEKFLWLTMEDVLIKTMTLPPGVQEAIVRKNAAYHQIEEYANRVKKEEREAERKRIEAVGIRNFQEIVSNGMSDSYLRWRGIEATLELAKSQNAKVVVIGNNKNGLPLILNMDSMDIEALRRAAAKSEPKPAPSHQVEPTHAPKANPVHAPTPAAPAPKN